jgi:hypothetical protein
MNLSKYASMVTVLQGVVLLAAFPLLIASPMADAQSRAAVEPARDCAPAVLGSPYIPVDSWVYPAVLRLYSLGYVDTVYLGMRPWTRSSISHMLEETGANIEDAKPGPEVDEAQGIFEALSRELRADSQGPCLALHGLARIESTYTVMRGISGTPLRDSFHLGSTVVNDYGRPYENGFNNYTGASGYASVGRFTLYARGEFHDAPSADGYSQTLAQKLSMVDGTTYTDPTTQIKSYNLPQATIPMGPIGSTTNGRFIEAYASANLLSHEISFGKQDDWLGPALGGGMAYSNNAENIYSFRVNRVEPLRVPGISRLTGPFRYEILVGSLRGHTYMSNPAYPGDGKPNPNHINNVLNPGNPWVHVEKVSLRPTENLEFGFERTAIWGGKGHSPITLHSFLKSFFSTTAGSASTKSGRNDPGARFAAFDFSYRLPFLRHWLTLYSDSEVHDDISPADAPRRAGWRPGLYLSHVPGIAKLDMRVEAVSTDPPVKNSQRGQFMYWEGIQRQGYTNQGQIFGDWIGREAKGGQAWATYHLSGNEWLQVSLRNQKAEHDFISGGTTLNDIDFQAVKRVGKDLEVNGKFSYEHWKAPIYLVGQHTVTTTTIQLTWYPDRKTSF